MSPNSVPQGLREPLWGSLLAATVPTACVPALVTRWVLVPMLQQRRARFDVCCRVRPLIRREIERGWAAGISIGPVARPSQPSGEAAPSCDRECGVSLDAEENSTGGPSRGVLFTPGNVTVSTPAAAGQTFNLDSVVTGTDQALPFAVVRPYVKRFVDRAEPGAVVAYGQTSAGKTHTILGDAAEGMEGATVRGVRLVLERLAATNGCHQSERRVLLVNMYEVYLEALRDFTPTPGDIGAAPSDGARAEVDAFVAKGRWAPPCHREGVTDTSPRSKMGQCGHCTAHYVQGSTPLYVDSTETFAAALELAVQRRVVAQTHMNAASSRSNFVVSLGLATVPKCPETDGQRFAVGPWFDFVDLAGSERPASTAAFGPQLRERVSMSRTQNVLGFVTQAITNQTRVPYRQSLVTWLLQRSAFVDTARTLFIVCLSPADGNADETISTLRFGRTLRGSDRAISTASFDDSV